MRWAAVVLLLTAVNAQADLFSGKGLLRLANSGEPNGNPPIFGGRQK
jgi:hypothetical protein